MRSLLWEPNTDGFEGRIPGAAGVAARARRWGRKPDGVCQVVGTLAGGFAPEANTTGDVIFTCTDLQPDDAQVGRG